MKTETLQRRGRPKKAEQDKLHFLYVGMTKEELAAVDERAKFFGVSRSAFLRAAITKAINPEIDRPRTR